MTPETVIEKKLREFDEKFVVNDTCKKDVAFWEEVTPADVKQFLASAIRDAVKDVLQEQIDNALNYRIESHSQSIDIETFIDVNMKTIAEMGIE